MVSQQMFDVRIYFYLMTHTISSFPFQQLIWNSTFSLNTSHLHLSDCNSWFNINILKNTWRDGKILQVCCYAESVYLTVNVFFYPDIYCPWFTIVFCVAPMHSLTTKYKSLLINKVLNGFHKRERREKKDPVLSPKC